MKRYVLLGIITGVAIWQLISSLNVFNPLVLPPPTRVAVSLWEFSVSRDALADLAMTCFRFAVSFLLIVVLGLPLGILVSRFRRIGYALSLPMDFFRSLPAPALFPIFMLFLGIGDLSRVGLTIFSGSLIVAVYTNHGIQNCPQIKIRAAKSCGAQGFELFRRVEIGRAHV